PSPGVRTVVRGRGLQDDLRRDRADGGGGEERRPPPQGGTPAHRHGPSEEIHHRRAGTPRRAGRVHLPLSMKPAGGDVVNSGAESGFARGGAMLKWLRGFLMGGEALSPAEELSLLVQERRRLAENRASYQEFGFDAG